MRVISVLFALLFFTMVGTAQTPAPRPISAAQAKPAAPAKPSRLRLRAQAKPAAPAPTRSRRRTSPCSCAASCFPTPTSSSTRRTTIRPTKKEDGQFGDVYGGWQSVENAALALAESANLLMIPGRMCSNGKPAAA